MLIMYSNSFANSSLFLCVPAGARLPSGVTAVGRIGTFKIAKFPVSWTLTPIAGGVSASAPASGSVSPSYTFSGAFMCNQQGRAVATAPAPVYHTPAPHTPVHHTPVHHTPVHHGVAYAAPHHVAYVPPGMVVAHPGGMVITHPGGMVITHPGMVVAHPGMVVVRGGPRVGNPYGLRAPVGRRRC
jgi:hypothetical protein